MIAFLTSPSDIEARKELVRLRMEMHRQQLIYHAQPLASPAQRVRRLFQHDEGHGRGRGPLLLTATALLGLFGWRLGKVGRLARIGLVLYPLIRRGLRHT